MLRISVKVPNSYLEAVVNDNSRDSVFRIIHIFSLREAYAYLMDLANGVVSIIHVLYLGGTKNQNKTRSSLP